jgi:hypothetical protein
MKQLPSYFTLTVASHLYPGSNKSTLCPSLDAIHDSYLTTVNCVHVYTRKFNLYSRHPLSFLVSGQSDRSHNTPLRYWLRGIAGYCPVRIRYRPKQRSKNMAARTWRTNVNSFKAEHTLPSSLATPRHYSFRRLPTSRTLFDHHINSVSTAALKNHSWRCQFRHSVDQMK